jgi:tRNA C32,U32 (ribose-2'-O)-methylase TrmJ
MPCVLFRDGLSNESSRSSLMKPCRQPLVQEVNWTKPTAVVFGNEKHGVSQALIDAADHKVVIPMSGFAQSFNVSVAAAIVLYEAKQQRIREQGFHGTLTEGQQRVLTAIMMLRQQVRVSLVLDRLLTQVVRAECQSHHEQSVHVLVLSCLQVAPSALQCAMLIPACPAADWHSQIGVLEGGPCALSCARQ